MGGFEFFVGDGFSEEAEQGGGEVIWEFLEGEPFAAFALGNMAGRV